ncbi:MAG: ferrous iron transport protein B [Planctomycetota bacterium]|nr:MAG: ferrous iron transport protein B [Planctomycetota bacterium]
MNKPHLTIALAGNPNSGKTTIFNAITGSRQHVGNYPGVTVEKKEGTAILKGINLRVVDLPGTYSLTAYSIEEIIARNFIMDQNVDVVIDIIDSSNLERNLYLATQLLEFGVPLVLAFNMSDIAEARGYNIDDKKLSALLGVPIIHTIAHKGIGIQNLLATAVKIGQDGTQAVTNQRQIDYGREIEPHVQELTEMLTDNHRTAQQNRWYAIKLLENDSEAIKHLQKITNNKLENILDKAEKTRQHIEGICGDSPEIVLADRRYGFISGACTEAVTQSVEARHILSDQIDLVLTNRILGLPLFALLMYLVFQLTFTLAEPPMNWIEHGFAWLSQEITTWWPKDSESALKSLLIDGVIGGVGGVIVFLPNIVLLFLSIAVLEDSGYMARAAFIMDRLMHKIGLHGKSFIPMLIGFGCSVPGILATRTLETHRDRLTTMLVLPLISCGARLPIYALIIPAFFPNQWRAPMLWIIYTIGIVLAIICAKLLRSTLFRGETIPFVMELPPYRLPTVKGLLIHMWDRSWLYLRKAGTIILGISIILWFLTTFPNKTQFDQDYFSLREQALADYYAKIPALNAYLGLKEDSDLLTQALQTEMNMSNKQPEYYEDKSNFADTEGHKNAVVDNLKQFPDYQALAEFLNALDTVIAINRELEQNEAQKIDPKIHAAALHYLENIKKPLDERLLQIERFKQTEKLTYSVVGRIGQGIEPVLRPMGFDWRIGTALIGAMAAKEVFVAQMGIVYSVGETNKESESLRERLRENYTPLIGFCIMLFCLIASPCMATIATTRRESNSWKWAIFQFCSLTLLAYILTVAVFQIGRLVI